MTKPILFSTPMVKAILEGNKTQTRRQLPEWCSEFKSAEIVKDPELCDPKALEMNEIEPKQFYGSYISFDNGEEHFKCKYEIGDVLWVRETWQQKSEKIQYPDFIEWCAKPGYIYKSDGAILNNESLSFSKWKPSIFMPKAACRIFLKIKDIRVERLHDITPNDTIEEGIEYWNIDKDALSGGELVADFKNYKWKDKPNDQFYDFPSFGSCIDSYKSLWQKINGEESWNDNPFVLVIEFEKTDKPIHFK